MERLIIVRSILTVVLTSPWVAAQTRPTDLGRGQGLYE